MKGFFQSIIPYEVRIPNGDSSPYFGNYTGQKYGRFETSTCWMFGACNNIETQLELEAKFGRFSADQMKWFKDNGYIDEDGDFYLSRRWGAILSGAKDGGNDEAEAWKIAEKYGMIPFSMLPYSIEDTLDEETLKDFVDEYFDTRVITQEMKNLGKEFLKRVKIRSEEFGTRWQDKKVDEIIKALKQASLQIGIPVPWYWNQMEVKWDGTTQPEHSVELYKYVLGDEYPYFIFDSYEPHLKQLSKDFFIPIATRGIVTAIPDMLTPTISISVWQRVVAILRRIGLLSYA